MTFIYYVTFPIILVRISLEHCISDFTTVTELGGYKITLFNFHVTPTLI